ncbi:branched-chain amino acid ABC transporter permease [Candidatus Aerophobetes bacterium]|nr:branched-chain amino acid ABC transporter permease [Candidatus Aerophobetes bacterium]
MSRVIIQLIINGLLAGGIYALVSIGLCLIFGVVEVINFAHGEFLMLGMYTTYWLFYFFKIDPYLSLLIVIPLSFLIGVITQRVLIQPLLDAPPLNQIFVTMGLSILLQNVALILWKATYRTIKTTYSSWFIKSGGLSISFPRLLACIVASGITVALLIFLKKTYVGKAIRAIAQDKRGATLMGINVHRMYQLTFGLGTVCVGIAGAILMPIYYAFPTVGLLFCLTAFAVVIVGGYNSLTGAFIAGFVIGLIESFSGFFISPHLQQGVYFAIVILVLLFKPSGLLGLKES